MTVKRKSLNIYIEYKALLNKKNAGMEVDTSAIIRKLTTAILTLQNYIKEQLYACDEENLEVQLQNIEIAKYLCENANSLISGFKNNQFIKEEYLLAIKLMSKMIDYYVQETIVPYEAPLSERAVEDRLLVPNIPSRIISYSEIIEEPDEEPKKPLCQIDFRKEKPHYHALSYVGLTL